jgi:subtilisin family serine protease
LLVFSGCSMDNTPLDSGEDSPVLNYDIDAMNAGDKIPGEYIIVLRSEGIQSVDSKVNQTVFTVCNDYQIPVNNVHFIYDVALKGFAATISPSVIAKMSKDSRILYVEQDQVVKMIGGKPESSSDSKNEILAQTTPAGITRVGGAGNGSGKRVYVIDTGVDLDHPDLNVDVSKSRTYITSGKDSRNADDGNGHGSHVAGTIAAKNNSSYVVGVAAGASVVAVKVLNSQGSGTTSGVIAGVNYVASVGAAGEVANMSLGGGISTALDNAVISASSVVKFSLAAGNSSASASNSSPARANGANIYTVSAVSTSNVFASFSNYGNPPIDYAAPGVSVLSTYKNGGTATMSGTSMAAPHVAGILLLGSPTTDGYATSDPDGNPDPIAHR